MKINSIKTTIMNITKRILWTITWLLLINFSAHAQGWERGYDYDEIPGATLEHLLEVGNNEHLLMGNSFPDFSLTDNAIFLLKIDMNGDTIWLAKDPVLNKTLYGATSTPDGIVYASGLGILGLDSVSQITKFDLDGNLVWTQNYPGSLAGDIVQSNDGGFIMVRQRRFYSSGVIDSIRVTKLDSDGNLIWQNQYYGTFSESGKQVLELPDGSIVIAGGTNNFSTTNSFILLKLDPNGAIIWKNYFPNFNFINSRSLILTNNNEFVAIGGNFVARFDNSGDLSWVEEFDDFSVYDIKELSNGTLALTSVRSGNRFSVNLHNLTASGDENWMQPYLRPTVDLFEPKINCTADDGFLIGTYGLEYVPTVDTFPIVFKVDSLGEIYGNQLIGEVSNDENDDCLVTSDETPLEGWIVAAANSENTFYGIVDDQGGYEIQVDTGSYIVSVLEPFNYWEPCLDSILQEVLLFDTINIDFPMQGLVDCPLMTVDIASFNLVRCFSNTYFVNYCNYGTIEATDAFVEIDFDSDLQVDSASLMWTSVIGNTYTFDLGDLPINSCGNFEIYTTLDPDCDSTVLGETHCVEAHIFPDSFCLWMPFVMAIVFVFRLQILE